MSDKKYITNIDENTPGIVLKERDETLEAGYKAILPVTMAKYVVQDQDRNFISTLERNKLASLSGGYIDPNTGVFEISANHAVIGKIDTANVTIGGEDGRFQIFNNKLQVSTYEYKDGSSIPELYEGIFLGIEADDDGNETPKLSLRGKDGETVIVDPKGITRVAYTDGWNRLDKGSLDATKIDIETMISSINADEKNVINASKIFLDDKTLDVAFREMVGTNESYASSISANAKAIEAKVESSTYKKFVNENNEKLNDIENNTVYKVEIDSTNGNIFRNDIIETTLSPKVFKGTNNVTDDLDASCFRWYRTSDYLTEDNSWNASNGTGVKSIHIDGDDLYKKATFKLEIIKSITDDDDITTLKQIALGSITIINYDDATVLNTFIECNNTRSQILDPDSNSLSPDWEETNLVLFPSLYKLGGTENLFEMDDNGDTIISPDIESVTWYVDNNKIEPSSGDELPNYQDSNYYELSGSLSQILTVKKNVIDNSTQSVIFRTEIVYKDESLDSLRLVQKADITFFRVLNGGSLSVAMIETPEGNVFKNSNISDNDEITPLTATANFFRSGTLDNTNKTYKWYIRDRNIAGDLLAGDGWRALGQNDENFEGTDTITLSIYPDAVVSFEVFKVLITDNTDNEYWDVVSFIDNTDPIQTIVQSTNGNFFKNGKGSTKLYGKLYRKGEELQDLSKYVFSWSKYNSDGELDLEFATKTANPLSVEDNDVDKKSTFLLTVFKNDIIVSSNQITIIDLNDLTGSSEPPTDLNAPWLDTNKVPAIIKVYNNDQGKWVIQHDWTDTTKKLESDISVENRTKEMGIELFDISYKTLTSAEPFPFNDKGIENTEYSVIHDNTYSISQNVIKLNNSCVLYSPYEQYIALYPYYISLDYYNETTSNGKFIVSIEYYDINKDLIEDSETIIIEDPAINPVIDTWRTVDGFTENSTKEDVIEKAIFVRFVIKNRYELNEGKTYLKDIHIKQLGNVSTDIDGETWTKKVADIKTTTDEINIFVGKQEDTNKSTTNELGKINSNISTQEKRLAEIKLMNNLINLSVSSETTSVETLLNELPMEERNLYVNGYKEISSTDNFFNLDVSDIVNTRLNEDLTVSFDIKTSISDNVLIYYSGKYGVIGSDNISVTEEYQRFNYSGNISKLNSDLSESYFDFQASSDSTVISLKNIKIEEGSEASDWSFAPEDVLKSYNKINESIAANTASIKLTDNSITSVVSSSKEYTKNYVNSRGENLVTNGTGLLKDNNNFSNFKFDGSDNYESSGSFTCDEYNALYGIDDVIPVDPSLDYKMSYYIKGSPCVSSKYYGILICYDIDDKQIDDRHSMYEPNTLTSLSQDLNYGDTKIYLDDVTNWNNSTGTASHRRSMIVWNYENSHGYKYPPETYSRNFYGYDLWSDGAINSEDNYITLNEPWKEDIIVAGTKVSNGSSGITFKYITGNDLTITDKWVHRFGSIGGVDYSGSNNTFKFQPGTAGIKIGWMLNAGVPNGKSWISNISFGLNNATQEEVNSISNRVLVNESSIVQTAESITNLVTKTDGLSTSLSEIKQTADGITSTVTGISSNVDNFNETVDNINENVDFINAQDMYDVKITSSNGESFVNSEISTVLSAKVFSWDEDITDTIDESNFSWKRITDDEEADTIWNNSCPHAKEITINENDLESKAVFKCNINID